MHTRSWGLTFSNDRGCKCVFPFPVAKLRNVKEMGLDGQRRGAFSSPHPPWPPTKGGAERG